jgi:hypothetical protein
MLHPAAVDETELLEIIQCAHCESDRRPRMYVCEYHEGWLAGRAAAEREAALEADEPIYRSRRNSRIRARLCTIMVPLVLLPLEGVWVLELLPVPTRRQPRT